MALTSEGFELVVVLQGSSKATSTFRGKLSSADYATAVTDANSVLTALLGMTDAKIKRYTIAERFTEDAFTAPLGVQVTDQIVLSGDIDGEPDKSCQVRIPGVARSAAAVDGRLLAETGANANIVDLSESLVTTFWALYQTGGPLLISDGEKANSLLAGKLVSRQSTSP
jgi:hypothetical protein